MKLTTFIMIISFMQVTAASFGQSVTLKEDKVSMTKLFYEIRKQTGYNVILEDNKILSTKQINANFSNTPLNQVMEQVVSGTDLMYEISNKKVVIKEKEKPFLESLIRRFQQIDVRGRIIDKDGNGLSGATISVKGTNQTTTAKINGEFELKGVEENTTLIISYIGYETRQIIATPILGNIQLLQSSTLLDEIQVVTYGATSKRLSTSNISSIKSEDISKAPVSDPLAALQGLVPGLLIQNTSGIPGRAFNVIIRGRNSLTNPTNSAVQNYPLYVVDGLPFNSTPLNTSIFTPGAGQLTSPLNDINPNDIESIEILKDADATAIYGSLGSNGVIIINTKKGKAGKTVISGNVYGGVSNISYVPKLMNTEEYLAMREQAFKNDGTAISTTDYDLNGTWDKSRYTDWTKKLIGNSARVVDAQISLTGGNQSTQFRLSTGYRHDETVSYGNFGSTKVSAGLSLNHTTTNNKFKVGYSGSLVQNTANLMTDDMTQYVYLAPNAPDPYLNDGTLDWTTPGTTANVFALFNIKNNEKSLSLINNLSLSYELISGLTLKSNFGYNITQLQQERIQPFSSFRPTTSNPDTRRSFRTSKNSITMWAVEPQLVYRKTLNKSIFDIVIGSTFQSRDDERLTQQATGYPSDATIKSLIVGQTKSIQDDLTSQYRYTGVYGKATYNLANRYIFSLSARRDGSSRFGPERKFGNFGAIGVAWLFSNEDFFKNNMDIISFGKLRASVGSAGNDRLGDYRFMSTYSIFTGSYQDNSSLQPTQHTNPYFSWEKITKREIGLDLGVANDRIIASISYYNHKSGNQLVGINLPALTGFTAITGNLPAIIENKGLEIELNTINIIGRNFRWTSSFNINVPRNKLVSYPNLESSTNATRYQVGLPLSITPRYNYLGINPTTGFYIFEDKNKDGNITASFDTEFVNLDQKYYGGFSNKFTYRDWSLDFSFFFVKQLGQNLLFNIMPGLFSASLSNQPKSIIGSDLIFPYSQSFGDKLTNASLFDSSNGKIRDASYIQLKNVSLSWNLPNKWRDIAFIQNGKIFMQGQNLFTLSNYEGYNPEYPQSIPTMPPLRTITFGLRLEF